MTSQAEEQSDPDHPTYATVRTPRLSQAEKAKILDVSSEDDAVLSRQVPLLKLFSFADSTDKILMALGTIGALGAGILRPLMNLLLGNVINSFGSTTGEGSSSDDFSPSVNRVARNLAIVGTVGLVAGYLQVYCWSLTASRQSKRIRSLYVNAIVTKEIGWFDVNDPMQLSSRVTDATITIQDGIGSKMSDMLHFSATVVSGILIAFVKGWELTLILMAVVPFVAASGMLAKKVIAAATHKGMQAYAQAGAVAQESLSNIRTVHMFNSVPYFVENCYDGGRVFTVFFAVMQGAMALGQAGPSLQAVYSACAAAFDVFEVIKRPSMIDPTNDDQGKKLDHVSGDIDIDNAGETVALVGPSGSGKSTVISLLERFYDPLDGSVKIDGEDVRSLNVKWLRQQVGLVGQEPVLFATSIMENIRHGRPGASDSDVVEAAKMANAFTFIMEFPEGFATELEHSRVSSKSSVLEMGVYNTSKTNKSECDDTDIPDVSTLRIWKMGLPEWKLMALGGVSSVFKGSVYPLAGMFIAKIIHLYFELQKTKHEMLHDMRYYSLALGCIAVVCCTSFTLTEYWFGIASSRLISRVRLATYSGMLRQEVGWFDLKENASGSLVSQLAADSAILQSMTSDFLNRSLMIGTTFTVIFAISFSYSWEMTLVMIAITPFLVGANLVRVQHMAGQMNAKKNNDADAAAGSLLSEAIGSIRTVASFGMEKSVTALYTSFLDVSNDQDKNLSVSGGVSFGLSQGMIFWVLAFVFYIGGIFVSHGTISFEDLFVVLIVFMMGSFSVSMASQGSVDGDKAKRAAANVFKIIDRVPEIDATSTAGTVLPSIQGNIDFKDLTFAYPSRPDAVIYQGYNLSVRRGQTVALVGASGSGKSTAIALLERFYDPSSGAVTLDGHDVRSLRLPWLRDRISLVSQEPVLFSGTIAENIALGKPGASRAEVEAAAKSANAFDFISNFPQGFDTEVGDRGAQVSGGQKQRIAIARAILRDPDVLLLDEATSALDNESEHIVQASLDALMAQKQRTTIVVAHRLSTIRKADVIAVTCDGSIVELGSHEELMRLPGGEYRGMVEQQTGTVA
ncbi:P-loop containing nucleoside triphosphate hydrolase [Phytophthora cactorum]|nr:P-loop containing nucleoside triphosphate hydrolase [Phytophthora cactorum]